MNSRHLSLCNLRLVLAGFTLILVSAACGAASPAAEATEPAMTEFFEPPAAEEPPPLLTPAMTAVPLPTGTAVSSVSEPRPAINESRRLTLEFPPQIRVGEGDVIRLTLEVDELGNLTPTAEVEGNVVTGETVVIPNLYETHTVTAEARLDLAGVEVKPADLISEPLTQGESVTFFWSIRPPEVGIYRGTIWLHLRFKDKSDGEESRKTVSAQMVEIEAVNLLGLPLGLVRGAGAVGSVIGGILGFPFLEDIVKFLFRRRGR